MLEFKAHFKSVQSDLGGSLPGNLIFGIPGEAGGYYTIQITQPDISTMRLTFLPSKQDMDQIDPVDIILPEGPKGDPGQADEDQVKQFIVEYLTQNPPKVEETDPTVPEWAKQPQKPAYTAAEVCAVSQEDLEHSIDEALEEAKKNGEFDGAAGKTAYEYAKEGGYTGTETEFSEKLAKEYPEKVSQLENDSQYINAAGAPVQSINGKTGKVQLGAADVGARPFSWMPTAQEVGALPDTYVPPDQTAAQVGADPAGTAAAAVSAHNTSTDSHGDLRLELKAISDRLTAFFDSDNQTLDELSEIVAYITSNKALIDSITTSKVSVADIINNLTTNVSTKPLSAAQGVVLSGLIDTLSKKLANYQPKGDYALRSEIPTVPSKVSAFTNDAGYLTQHQDISGKVNKNGLTLGIHTDGLVYVFVDGVPVGNGIEMGASGDVFGYVDENNNIVVQGNLPDGTYSVKYEMEDGSTVNIGNLVLDTNVYYSVTNTLTNCVSSNSDTQAIGGKSYSATISANDGYELSSVVVTMGGTDISSTAVSGGNISIANVTGNIVITAVAEEIVASYTNLFVPSEATLNTRLNSSAAVTATDGYVLTNFMDVSGKTPFTASTKIYMKGVDIKGDGSSRIFVYKTTGTTYTSPHGIVNANNMAITDEGNGVISITGLNSAFASGVVRAVMCLKVSSSAIAASDIEDIVITIDEPIV